LGVIGPRKTNISTNEANREESLKKVIKIYGKVTTRDRHFFKEAKTDKRDLLVALVGSEVRVKVRFSGSAS